MGIMAPIFYLRLSKLKRYVLAAPILLNLRQNVHFHVSCDLVLYSSLLSVFYEYTASVHLFARSRWEFHAVPFVEIGLPRETHRHMRVMRKLCERKTYIQIHCFTFFTILSLRFHRFRCSISSADTAKHEVYAMIPSFW